MTIRSLLVITTASLALAAPAGAAPADLRTEAARDAGVGAVSGAGAPGPQDLRSPDARDGTGTRTPVVPDPVVVRVSQPSAEGISWASAAVGALIASGLLITLAGGGMVATRRRVHGA
jgi:hypothetical protein